MIKLLETVRDNPSCERTTKYSDAHQHKSQLEMELFEEAGPKASPARNLFAGAPSQVVLNDMYNHPGPFDWPKLGS